MKNYVQLSVVLGIKMAKLTLQSVINKRIIEDKYAQPVLSLSEIIEILEKLVKDEENI